LHPKTLQVLASILDFRMDAQAGVEQPAFLLEDFSTTRPAAQVERGQFDGKLLEATRGLGQEIREVSTLAAGALRGYWVGVHIAPDGNLRGVGTRQAPLPSVAEAY
jgi:hypothetical protein